MSPCFGSLRFAHTRRAPLQPPGTPPRDQSFSAFPLTTSIPYCNSGWKLSTRQRALKQTARLSLSPLEHGSPCFLLGCCTNWYIEASCREHMLSYCEPSREGLGGSVMLKLVSLFNSRFLCFPTAAALGLHFSQALLQPQASQQLWFLKDRHNYICTELFLLINITDVKTVQEVRES